LVLPESLRGELEYVRFSPDGKYALMTTYSPPSTILVDLSKKKPNGEVDVRVVKTPLRIESYAIEPNWDFILSPLDDGGTKFYKLSDLLQLGPDAKSVYFDEDFAEYYSSAAMTKRNGLTDGEFRVMGWNGLTSKTYSIDANKIKTKTSSHPLCVNLLNLSKKDKEAYPACISLTHQRMYRVMNAYEKFEQVNPEAEGDDYSAFERTLDNGLHLEKHKKEWLSLGCEVVLKQPALLGKKMGNMGSRYSKLGKENFNLKMNRLEGEMTVVEESEEFLRCNKLENIKDFPKAEQLKMGKLGCYTIADKIESFEATVNAANPILSKDGTELALIDHELGANVSIFKINNDDNTCTKTDTIDFRGSKVNFDHPRGEGPSRIAFTGMASSAEEIIAGSDGSAQVIIYDRNTKQSISVNEDSDTSNSYPSFLLDGRVVYYENGSDEKNFTDEKSSKNPRFVYIDPNQYFDGQKCIEKAVVRNEKNIRKEQSSN